MSVPRPVTLAPEMRGRTTQNFVSDARNSSVLGAICALMITRWWSSESRIDDTVPISTPLYWSLVLPASRPSAVRKTIVIVGPSLRILVTATHTPTSAARIGMNHTSDSRVRLRVRPFDSGTGGKGRSLSAIEYLFRTRRIPDEARIERLHRQHRQHHHRRKEQQPGPRRDIHKWLKLNQRRGESIDEHIDHRPAPDELHHPVQPYPLPAVLHRSPLRAYQQVAQRQDLRAWDHDARHQDDQRQRPS